MSSTEITDEKPKSPCISDTSSSIAKHSDFFGSNDDEIVAEKLSKRQTSNRKKSSFENVLHGDTVIEELRKRKEEEGEVEVEEDGEGKLEDVFPDGGLRAWLVVFGVRQS